jgi:hypothetical protein
MIHLLALLCLASISAVTVVSAEETDLRYRNPRLVPITGRWTHTFHVTKQPDGKIHLDDLLEQGKEKYLSGDISGADGSFRGALIMQHPPRDEVVGLTDTGKEVERFCIKYLSTEKSYRRDLHADWTEGLSPEAPAQRIQTVESDFTSGTRLEQPDRYMALAKAVNKSFCGLLRSTRVSENGALAPTVFPVLSLFVGSDGSFLDANLKSTCGVPNIDRQALNAAVLATPCHEMPTQSSTSDAFRIDIQLSSDENSCSILSGFEGKRNDAKEEDNLRQVMKSSGLVYKSAEDWAVLAYYLEDRTENLSPTADPTYGFIAWRKAYSMDRRPEYEQRFCQALAEKVTSSSVVSAVAAYPSNVRPLELGKLFQMAERFPLARVCYEFELFIDPQNKGAQALKHEIADPPVTAITQGAKVFSESDLSKPSDCLSRMIDWLPSTSETVICSQLQSSELSGNGNITEACLGSMAPLEAMFATKAFTKDQCMGRISGAARFRPPSGLGVWTYTGATIFLYRELDLKKLNDVIGTCNQKYQEHGIDVWCHHEEMEHDDGEFLYCLPAPHLLVVATDRLYLKALLERMTGQSNVSADSVKHHPEYQFVDKAKPYWAMRHFDWKYIRYQGMDLPLLGDKSKSLDGKVDGLIISSEAAPDRISLRYLVPNQVAREILKTNLQAAKEYLHFNSVVVEGNWLIVMLTVSGDQQKMSAAFTLECILGHAVNL